MDVQMRRIDYVRLRLPNDGLEKAEAAASWTQALDRICDYHGLERKCYGFDMYFDPGLERKVPYFNVWGLAAEYFYRTLSVEELRNLMRLDVRWTIDGEGIDFDMLFFLLKKRNRDLISTKLYTGRQRKKTGGRDTGGDYIGLGAEGSQRRVSIYNRSEQGPVWEYQCNGLALETLRRNTLSQLDVSQKTPQFALREAIEQEAQKYFLKYTGFSADRLAAGLPEMRGIADYTDPGHLMSQLDLFWAALDPERREDWLSKNTNLDPATIARAAEVPMFRDAGQWEEDAAPVEYTEAELEAMQQQMLATIEELAQPLSDVRLKAFIDPDTGIIRFTEAPEE